MVNSADKLKMRRADGKFYPPILPLGPAMTTLMVSFDMVSPTFLLLF